MKPLDKLKTTLRQRINHINKELGYGSVFKDTQMSQEQSTVYMKYTEVYGNHPREEKINNENLPALYRN